MYNEKESNKRMNVIGQNGNTGEHYKKSDNMFIEVFLKKEEGGCNFSKDFEREFINGVKLHPKVEEAKKSNFKCKWYDNIPFPEVIVKDENDKIIYHVKGNQVLASRLQKFIIENF